MEESAANDTHLESLCADRQLDEGDNSATEIMDGQVNNNPAASASHADDKRMQFADGISDQQSAEESTEPPELPDSLQFILDSASDPTNPLFIPSKRRRGRSEEGKLRRSGIHPVTKLHVRSCACSKSAECRAIMWRWAELNEMSMFPYLRLPVYPKKETSVTAWHLIQFREVVSHHLYGDGSDKDLVKGKVTGKTHQDWVAMHHFPPEIRPYVQSGEGQSKQFKWRIPLEIGKKYGLGQRELCKTADEYGHLGKTFMCAPTVTFAQSYAEIEEAEQMYGIRHDAANPASAAARSKAGKESSGSKVRRKSPKEREVDRITRDVQANPRAAALQIFDLKEEIEELKQQLASVAQYEE